MSDLHQRVLTKYRDQLQVIHKCVHPRDSLSDQLHDILTNGPCALFNLMVMIWAIYTVHRPPLDEEPKFITLEA